MQNQNLSFARLRMLVWKECREWRWPFLLYVVVMVGQYLWMLKYLSRLEDAVGFSIVLCIAWGWFVPILVAIRTAHHERNEKTVGFTAALPCSLQTVAWMRLAAATVVLVGPQLAVAALVAIPAQAGWGQLGQGTWEKRIEVLSTFGTVLPLMWAQQVAVVVMTSLLAAKRRTEVQVGAIGVVVTICEAAVFMYSRFLNDFYGPSLVWSTLLGVVSPLTMIDFHSHTGIHLVPHAAWKMVLHLLFVLGLGYGFSRRYGGKTSDQSPGLASISNYLGLEPLLASQTRWGALAWLHLRQALPLTLAGVLIACLVGPLLTWMVQPVTNHPDAWQLRMMHLSLVAIYVVGFFWPLVVGAGLFAAELRRDLGYFWRSRPIHPGAWFWLKFMIGLVAIIVSLDLLPAAINYAARWWFPSTKLLSNHQVQVNLACLTLLHAECYALAVLGVAVFRKPLLAAGLGFLAITVFELTIYNFGGYHNSPAVREYSPLYVYTHLVEPPPQIKDVWALAGWVYLKAYGLVVAVTIIAAVLASLAARRVHVLPVTTVLARLFERFQDRTSTKPSAV